MLHPGVGRACFVHRAHRWATDHPHLRPAGVREVPVTSSVWDRKQPPRHGDTFQIVLATILECDSGSCHQVSHGSRDENLPRSSNSGHSCADVNSDPADVVPSGFNFAGVEADTYVEAQGSCALSYALSTLNRSSRAIKRDQKAITGRLDLIATMSGQLVTNHAIMSVEIPVPFSIADCVGKPRRVHDVSEQDSGQKPAGSATGGIPVTNSCTASRIESAYCVCGMASVPGISTNRAPWVRSLRRRAKSTG